MFNKVIMVGNLTRDVELKYLPSGSAVAKIGLASNRKYKKQDGESAEDTCFVDVSLFGRTAEVANQYLKKGSQVLIEGRLNFETWTDASGQKRSKHTITAESMQMLGSKPSAESSAYNASQSGSYGASQAYSQAPKQAPNQAPREEKVPEIDIDDEIPF